MASKVKLLLIATSSGKSLASQIQESGLYKDLLHGSDGVTLPLICVNGMPIISYWLRSILDCPRLLPLEEKVFIICNEHNYIDIVDWSQSPDLSFGGFPVDNIINAGSAMDPHEALVQFLSSGLISPSGEHLVAAHCGSLFELNFNLQRAVEHFMISCKDTIAFWNAPETFPSNGRNSVPLTFDSAGGRALKAVEPSAVDLATGTSTLSAPLLLLRSPSFPIIAPATASCSSFALACQQLLAAGKLVLGTPVDFFFSFDNLDTLDIASNFYSYHVSRTDASTRPAALALQDVLYVKPPAMRRTLLQAQTRTLGAAAAQAAAAAQDEQELKLLQSQSKTQTATLDAITRAAIGSVSNEVSILKQWQEFWELRCVGARFERMSGLVSGARGLPLRFAEPASRCHLPRDQHPVFTSSSNDYGRKAATALEMPTVFRGSRGAFTKSFPSMTRDTGLVTATTPSKVHRALDEF